MVFPPSREVSPILKEVLQKLVFHQQKGKKSIARTVHMPRHMTGQAFITMMEEKERKKQEEIELKEKHKLEREEKKKICDRLKLEKEEDRKRKKELAAVKRKSKVSLTNSKVSRYQNPDKGSPAQPPPSPTRQFDVWSAVKLKIIHQ